MFYIVKSHDNRYLYLNEFLSSKYTCEYSYTLPTISVSKIVLPLEGIDEFGYIKGVNIKLEKILDDNKISEIYTGRINGKLKILSQKYNFTIFSFYEDMNYCKNEFLLKLDVIKLFLQEKLNTSFKDIKVLIVGCDYKAYLASEKLGVDIFDKGSISNRSIKDFLSNNYDVIINFSSDDISFMSDKLVVEMNDFSSIDLTILLSSKNIYFINQLINQYLTKSGGKILYDSMVKR